MELSPRINPAKPTGLDYYVLNEPGERFPKFDPHKQPCMEPRPADDAVFLQGLLEAMAKTEATGYRWSLLSSHQTEVREEERREMMTMTACLMTNEQRATGVVVYSFEYVLSTSWLSVAR